MFYSRLTIIIMAQLLTHEIFFLLVIDSLCARCYNHKKLMALEQDIFADCTASDSIVSINVFISKFLTSTRNK